MKRQQNDMFAQATGWITDAVRRKPEALLLFAAGCALMLRGSSATASAYTSSASDYADNARRRMGDFTADMQHRLSTTTDYVSERAQSAMHSASDTVREQP